MKRLPAVVFFPVLALAFCSNTTSVVAQGTRQIQFDSGNASARVFVEDRTAKAGTGPNGVQHVAGIRPATDDDDGASNVMAADAGSLLVSLDKWRSAEGTAQIKSAGDNRDRLTFMFKNLIAFGEYSLFLVDLSNPDEYALAALDGGGTNNSFEAKIDGTASPSMTAQKHLGHDDAIVLIYHSDDTEHGPAPGQLFVDAHEQLIARIP